jgi:hypothetical protein
MSGMSSKKTKNDSVLTEALGEIPLRSKVAEFSPGEMLKCPKCERSTPPNRLDCIYCGTKLELDDETGSALRPVIRPAKEGEPSYTLGCFAAQEWTEDLASLAELMTRLERGQLELLALSGCAVPLARGGSEEEVEIAVKRLREKGMDAELIPDILLKQEFPPKRLRRISSDVENEFTFILFNNDEVERIKKSDIKLIVVGLAMESKTEADEKHKRKGLDKVVNETETSSDEILIDIYTDEEPGGFRIRIAGFDFSFLGSDKDLLASNNIEKTIDFLRKHAPNAIFNDSYRSLRSALDAVWAVDQTSHTASLKKKGFGSTQLKRITVSSNLEQFNQYSRLQFLVLSRKHGGIEKSG